MGARWTDRRSDTRLPRSRRDGDGRGHEEDEEEAGALIPFTAGRLLDRQHRELAPTSELPEMQLALEGTNSRGAVLKAGPCVCWDRAEPLR